MNDSVILEDSDMDDVESLGRQNSNGRPKAKPHIVTSYSFGNELSPKDATLLSFIRDDNDVTLNKNRFHDKARSQRSTSLFTFSSAKRNSKLRLQRAGTKESGFRSSLTFGTRTQGLINDETASKSTGTDTPTPTASPKKHSFKDLISKTENRRTSSGKLIKKRKNKIWRKGNIRKPTL